MFVQTLSAFDTNTMLYIMIAASPVSSLSERNTAAATLYASFNPLQIIPYFNLIFVADATDIVCGDKFYHVVKTQIGRKKMNI